MTAFLFTSYVHQTKGAFTLDAKQHKATQSNQNFMSSTFCEGLQTLQAVA